MENGDLFLQYDNNDPNERILIFGTDESLGFLSNADDWYMDGTFTVAPPQFSQLYTVHGLIGYHHVVGCMLCYQTKPKKHMLNSYGKFNGQQMGECLKQSWSILNKLALGQFRQSFRMHLYTDAYSILPNRYIVTSKLTAYNNNTLMTIISH